MRSNFKTYKKPKVDGSFPTRLVIPATNFTTTFLKIGYMGIKQILDEHKVSYEKYTILQASDLKKTLEKLNLTTKNAMLLSFSSNNVYPLIRV
eukprot:15364502-Ditylum_brightwellii.AAC.1